jgi:dTDP-4-dehydrorhamnose 3,5-epimerase
VRTYCSEEFERQGLDARVAQCNTSWNRRAGTLRGMHYQAPPHGESKLVRCTVGAVYDVLVDLREGPGRLSWCAVELTAENRRSVFVPEGVAHGFQTLRDSTEVLYQMSTPYVPSAARGVRWDDPAIGIEWPDAPEGRVVSERDSSYTLLSP